MLSYCQLDHTTQISVKLNLKFKSLHSRKYTSKHRLRNDGHFVSASICQMIQNMHTLTLIYVEHWFAKRNYATMSIFILSCEQTTVYVSLLWCLLWSRNDQCDSSLVILFSRCIFLWHLQCISTATNIPLTLSRIVYMCVKCHCSM